MFNYLLCSALSFAEGLFNGLDLSNGGEVRGKRREREGGGEREGERGGEREGGWREREKGWK